nr:hypothetical protein [Tanacetum cinerariifolium]
MSYSDAYTYPPLPRIPLSYQASACSLSTLHFLKFPENSFEVLKLLKNSVEVLKILKNKLESMKILENKLESLKLQENQPVDRLMETSATREYPSLIHTFFLTHTVGGVLLNLKDKALYDEILRLHGLGSNTPTGVPYTENEIMAIVREGKQRGHILGVGQVLPGQGTAIPPPSQSTHSADIARLKKREKRLTKQVNKFMRLFRSDNKFSQMLTQLESQPEYGGSSGSGGCGDDEPGDDKDDDEDEDDS